jgi:hypothetical protein
MSKKSLLVPKELLRGSLVAMSLVGYNNCGDKTQFNTQKSNDKSRATIETIGDDEKVQPQEYSGSRTIRNSESQTRIPSLPIPDITPLATAIPVTDLKPSPSPTSIPMATPSPTSTPNVWRASQEFTISELENPKVDVLWVIDNSSSMAEEVGQIRKHLKSFMESLDSKQDAHLMMISATQETDGKYGYTIEKSAKANQISLPVSSTNALALTLSALCGPLESGSSSTNSLCENLKIGKSSRGEIIDHAANVKKIHGKLPDFFRAEAKKVMIFVTDDNAADVDAKEFLLATKELLGDTPAVFAFRGNLKSSKKSSNCSVASSGVQYDELAHQTQGESFDVCLDDWQPHFSRLLKGLDQVEAGPFGFEKLVSSIENVVLIEEGKEPVAIDSQYYKIERNHLILSKDWKLKKGQKIKASFVYNP